MSQTPPKSSPEQPIEPAALPATPRPLTPKAARRLWAEPKIRFWWLSSLLILIWGLGLTIDRALEWRADNQLLDVGVPVKAVIWEAGGNLRNRPLSANPESPIDAEFEYQGKKYKATGYLVAAEKHSFTAGETIEVRIDPSDPTRWTNRIERAVLVEKLVGAMLLVVAGVVCGVIGLIERLRYASVWKNGEMTLARVVEHRTLAIAPRSVAVRCLIRVGRTDHLLNVYVPQAQATPAAGETVSLVTNASYSLGLAVANYHP